MTGRLGIDDVRPRILDGNPAKAVVGEIVPVSAIVWREGHDAIAATLNVSGPEDSSVAAEPIQIHMRPTPDNQDQSNAFFVPDVPGDWTFRVDAWSDPMATWRHAITTKIEAGQGSDELYNDFEHGAQLFERAAENLSKEDRTALFDVASSLRRGGDVRARLAPALTASVTRLLELNPLRELVTMGENLQVRVERRAALVNSWYELFPRSTGGWDESGTPVHGTFATTAQALERVAKMGFDTVYFPPIHPIGEVNRKGRNNTLTPEPHDVGSPWAIGSKDGGHDATHPRLGTIEDFQALLARARELNLEVALDLALQAAPDHPWAQEHREFFTVLADGTIAYAENPPKKYQDIYPINFDNAPEKIYAEIFRVVKFWVDLGVTTFRVDNPHTKPANFWQWLISAIHKSNPEVIFLAEAFTRPARLYGLAKIGFSQSYTYFTWKVTKEELTEFATEIARMADISRPNLFVNTPDILHASLQHGGRAMFAIRAALAATMSPVWGVYSGYELFEHEAVKPGSEEYLDSEKYELRPRDFEGALERGDSLEDYIALLNQIRRANPALQQLRNIHFHEADNDQIIAYSKVDALTGNTVLIVVNLDPRSAREATVRLDLGALGLEAGAQFEVRDAITGSRYLWSETNFVRLEPLRDVAHIFVLPELPASRRERLAWREIKTYRA
ncbi:glycosidase [Corynebacterium glutamicum MT]|uniref:Alpha-1,4-glucan:maltose-1-phosphate maltosyltransferase n=1 Tax=Corynebacterium glutamicum TaxID=1718 RepID=A0AB36IEY7_CORGT|nr:alpha-1,4-glucan--maltose-1-phosphate maltosyltransferase [Corynebacterium glutamicum]AGN18966.1 alpha-amylase [Corynebacterium glutamicum SCgG1]AGN21989.1 alpha-amylase [Corynebacterium glutamicum SCgG2]EGV41335.1 alpha-amylase [Corynebacterium glutamicum S9114]EOA65333.1 glycosidase [Corynebacterium glutamicum MT]EPP40995.1 alpha-amylase [Corynebacterium glutamicum Z188]